MVNKRGRPVARWSPNGYGRGILRRLILMLIIAVCVSACGKVDIGPVDHECHVNPATSQGSGCDTL
jgi:hypothetical protein